VALHDDHLSGDREGGDPEYVLGDERLVYLDEAREGGDHVAGDLGQSVCRERHRRLDIVGREGDRLAPDDLRNNVLLLGVHLHADPSRSWCGPWRRGPWLGHAVPERVVERAPDLVRLQPAGECGSGQLVTCLGLVQLSASDELPEREGGGVQRVVPTALRGAAEFGHDIPERGRAVGGGAARGRTRSQSR
jgi:hypothetical protein